MLKSGEQDSRNESQGNIIDFGNEILSSVAETCEWDEYIRENDKFRN